MIDLTCDEVHHRQIWNRIYPNDETIYNDSKMTHVSTLDKLAMNGNLCH